MAATATRPPFHLAFVVHDLAAARLFYGDVLGCTEGRSSDTWVDFNFYGHQIVAHVQANAVAGAAHGTQAVDGDVIPVPHFGAILSLAQWQALSERVRRAGIPFVVEPHVRFRGRSGEQSTMFFCDPSGNVLEFKAFADHNQIFAK